MSADGETAPGTDKAVVDEEGTVDGRNKQRVLKSRQKVDDIETALFMEGRLDPEFAVDAATATDAWAMAIRQYLRNIKPLLVNSDIYAAQEYWESVELGTERVVPPDCQGHEFSLVESEFSDEEIKRHLDLPHSATLPEPETIEFVGLQSILSITRISYQWTVKVDDTGPPITHDIVRPRVSRPIPKRILENAVEAADAFLQESGMGIDVDNDTLPVDEL